MAKKGIFGTKQWVSIVLIILVVVLAAVIIYAFRAQITGSAMTIPTSSPSPRCSNLYFDPNVQLKRSVLADSIGRTDPKYYYCPTIQTFKDVSPKDPAYCRIEGLYKAGIINGCRTDSAGKYFCPEDIATRSQIAVAIARLLAGGDANVPPGPASASFRDVTPVYYAYKYIEYVKVKGIMGGYGDGTFRPDNQADRASMAVVLSRAKFKTRIPSTPTFKDVPTNFWAFKEIEGVYGAGYMDSFCRTVSLALTPSSGTYRVGNTFSANVILNTGGNETSGADAIITYNPLDLEVIDVFGTIPGVQVQPGTLYPTYPGNKVDPTAGKISVSGAILGGTKGYNGTGTFAKVTFKVLRAAATSPVNFTFTPGGTTDSNVASTKEPGKDLLNEVTNARYILSNYATLAPSARF
ncbi:MAG: hypothetical protein HW405_517 [Candidatus Berkelbacteria bacterium]|nr:hypothetical protein [Candidatus Berkelbacteria bacterium]